MSDKCNATTQRPWPSLDEARADYTFAELWQLATEKISAASESAENTAANLRTTSVPPESGGMSLDRALNAHHYPPMPSAPSAERVGSDTPRMDATLGKGADWIFAEGCKLERELRALTIAFEAYRSSAPSSGELTMGQRQMAYTIARQYFWADSRYRGSEAQEQCRLAIVDALERALPSAAPAAALTEHETAAVAASASDAARLWVQQFQALPVLPPNAEEGFKAGAAWATGTLSATAATSPNPKNFPLCENGHTNNPDNAECWHHGCNGKIVRAADSQANDQ